MAPVKRYPKIFRTCLTLFVFSIFSIPASTCFGGKLYSDQELQSVGELWIRYKLLFQSEMKQHLTTIEEIKGLPLTVEQRGVRVQKEMARHRSVSDAFAKTRSMIQGVVINESNARLSKYSGSRKIAASAGKQPGDAGYRAGEADLDAGGSEIAVKHLKEVLNEMGLGALTDNIESAPWGKSGETAGVIEFGDSFELTINKGGLAPKPGSEYHQAVTSVDARHPETFLSQKLLHPDQAGKTYIELQDHLKKATKGHLLNGEDLLSSAENLQKARIMCKSTRKALDLDIVDNEILEKILKQNKLDMGPDKFKGLMKDIETSGSGELLVMLDDPAQMERIRRASEDIFAASDKTGFTKAKTEIVDLRAKAERLPQNSARRRALEDEIADSVAKIKAGRQANRELRGSSDLRVERSFEVVTPREMPAKAQQQLTEALHAPTEQPHVTKSTRRVENGAAIFKVYNDINDATQLAQVVEDYVEGRNSLGKTLLVATASVADMTVTQGAAGTVVQIGEKMDDQLDVWDSLNKAKKQNMTAYLNSFALQFRKAGMSKKEALRLIEQAEKDQDVSILKQKVAELRQAGHKVRMPRLHREKSISGDDSVVQRADQTLLGGGGQKISDWWDTMDKVDYANRVNLQSYLDRWEIEFRQAGMDQKEARRLVGRAILADNFKILEKKANQLRAGGRDIKSPRLVVDTLSTDKSIWGIKADDDTLQRLKEFGLTRHIMAPTRVVDAWAEGELAEADLEYASITQTARTKTELFRKLVTAGVNSKRALIALNNWEQGESGLLERVLDEARSNIRKQRLADDQLEAAREAEAARQEQLEQLNGKISKLLTLFNQLKNIKYQMECEPFPITYQPGQQTARAMLAVTAENDPEMVLLAIKALTKEIVGTTPAASINYKLSIPFEKEHQAGVWEIAFPAEEGEYNVDAWVKTSITNSGAGAEILDKVFQVKLPVSLRVEASDDSEEAVSKEKAPVQKKKGVTTGVAPELSIGVSAISSWKLSPSSNNRRVSLVRQLVSESSAGKDCGQRTVRGTWLARLDSDSPDSIDAIKREIEGLAESNRKEGYSMTVSPINIGNFKGYMEKSTRKYHKGHGGFSGFKSSGAAQFVKAYLVNPDRETLELRYHVNASGCWENSDKAWIISSAEQAATEAESMLASVKIIPGGSIEFVDPPPRPAVQAAPSGKAASSRPDKKQEVEKNDQQPINTEQTKTQKKQPQMVKTQKSPATPADPTTKAAGDQWQQVFTAQGNTEEMIEAGFTRPAKAVRIRLRTTRLSSRKGKKDSARIGELQFLDPSGKVVVPISARASSVTRPYSVVQLYDGVIEYTYQGNGSKGWASAYVPQESSQWIEYSFSHPVTISGFRLSTAPSNPYRIHSFVIETTIQPESDSGS